ncbi:MAG: lysylphosphatidylglycerol synthase transmembrane domain-containing protein, partial [Candidatus Altiarchaeota archaeon]|nr:lysylphosphatidylglycerol synthase transmembrane domain-containing protein [Candidatus Altiarchaeota archaeon]
AILLSQIDVRYLFIVISSISPAHLLLGFILYSLCYLFRTLRFALILNKKVNLKDLFLIVCVHNMANYLLPARTGEFSYVYLLKKSQGIRGSEGVATLMLARIFDVISISLIFFTSVFMVRSLPPIVSNAISGVAFSLLFIVLFLVYLLYYGNRFTVLITGVCSKLNLLRFHLVDFLLEKLKEIVGNLSSIRSKKTVFYFFIYSIFIWSSLYSMIYVLLDGMSIHLGTWVVILGSTFAILTGILPVQGLGGFGTYEGAWAVVFIPLGISKETAIASGFAVHILFLLYSMILGSLGLHRLGIKAFHRS